MVQKIIPHLWYDKEAKEAAEFYTSLLPNSEITHVTTLHNTPSGDSDIVSFTVWGYELMAISAGPYFKINPSISLMLNFDPSQDSNARELLDQVWKKLIDGGQALMPLDTYPFSEWYGWVQDKYGMTWQLILTNPDGEERPRVVPSMLFVGDQVGKAEEASDFYLSVFNNSPAKNNESKRGTIARYPAGMEPDKEGSIMFSDFMLEGQWFAAMDSAHEHKFAFNEGLSFIIECKDQEEIDYFWEKLSYDPKSEQCGWLKDKYGVSWQVEPREFKELMQTGTQEQIDRLTQAFLPMKKLNIGELKKAFEAK